MSPKKTGRCAFCAFEGRLSKEELWPHWARPYVREGDALEHAVSSSAIEVPRFAIANHVRRKSLLHGRPSRTLRVVCVRCNNEWMSRLQKRAQPVLTRLFSGDWTNLGGADERAILAAWCAMYSMVTEYMDPLTQATTPEERDELRRTGLAPANWTVWLGRFRPNDHLWNDAYNHFGLMGPVQSAPQDVAALEPTIQTTAKGANRLYLQTFSTRDSRISVNAGSFARAHGLVVVWPDDGQPLVLPPKDLTSFEADAASRAFCPPGMPIRYAWDTR